MISFPAFAVEDDDLVKDCREKIITKLQVSNSPFTNLFNICWVNWLNLHWVVPEKIPPPTDGTDSHVYLESYTKNSISTTISK